MSAECDGMWSVSTHADSWMSLPVRGFLLFSADQVRLGLGAGGARNRLPHDDDDVTSL